MIVEDTATVPKLALGAIFTREQLTVAMVIVQGSGMHARKAVALLQEYVIDPNLIDIQRNMGRQSASIDLSYMLYEWLTNPYQDFVLN